MPVLVNLPDGSQASFPDGTPPDVMKAAIQKRFPPQSAPAPVYDAIGQRSAPAVASSNIEDRTAAPVERPNLLNSTLATVNGLADAVPGLQQSTDALMGLGGMVMGKDYGQTVKGLQDRRAELAKAAPLARLSGDVAGTMAVPLSLGPKAAGFTGKFGERVLNSALSMGGYQGLQSMAHGKGGWDALAQTGEGLAGGAVAPFIGAAFEKSGGALANAVTRGAQNKLTTAAIKDGAPAAADLKNTASNLFESSTGGKPLMVTDNAYFRFLGDVKQVADKLRINSDNDQQSVGLLNSLMRIADDTANGVRPDMKDLHLMRQLAGDVADSPNGRDAAFGRAVIGKMDNFIKTLKPSDVLGGANPRDAANQLMTGISTWARAIKVGTVERAIKKADTYKSGFENGLKLSFLDLMKKPEFERLSQVEQDAIRTVAKGTTKQNIAEALGKLGFSFGGSASHNIIGGSLGTSGLASVLTPFLGPLAIPAALGTTTAVGAAGRAIAEKLASGGAARAAQIMATPGIPAARQFPNLTAPARVPLELLIRGGSTAAMSR